MENRNPIAPAPFSTPGCRTIRTLSDREKSKLYLARTHDGTRVALKVEQPNTPGKMQSILSRYGRLKELSRAPGLTPILDFGQTENGAIWHTMPLADNLPGLAPLTSEEGLQHYTPLTLGSLTVERGSATAEQVARWGLRIAGALAVLHRAGLVHRDVKPTNLVFVGGELALADYGLVGEPDSEFDFSGTEGFIPLQGTSKPAADLFALGRALYEAWSGKDRLEFPSLPVKATDGADWEKYGRALNAMILRSCHAQPSRRYGSAEAFAEALRQVLSGRNPVSRRRWLVAMGTAPLLAGAGFLIYRALPPATATWRRLRQKGFNVESWQGHAGATDWKRGKMYSICRDTSGLIFQILDLRTFDLSLRSLTPVPVQPVSSLLHPVTGKLWAVEAGRADVYEIDVDSGAVRNLGGGPDPKLYYAGVLYWNPVTRRVGTFGGYGYLSVRSTLHEFDEQAGAWVRLEVGEKSAQPWPRNLGATPLFAGAETTSLYLVGGNGSPSGKQGDKIPNLRGFNGQFYYLDDIWKLDLKQNRWTQILPNGLFPFPPVPMPVSFYHPALGAIIVLAGVGHESPEGGHVTTWMVRPRVDRKPLALRQQGEISTLGRPWGYALDPANQELLLLADDGIFRVSFQ